MKRMHVHVSVADINNAIRFYSALFATKPSIVKDDYAKWMLDDPRMNFAISSRGAAPGLDHLGIQVESESELQDVFSRLHEAGGNVIDEGKTTCCYANSEKSWIDDPAGISWETFYTSGESTNYGNSFDKEARIAHAKACCGSAVKPAAEQASCGCATA
jgi:predicted lactoylglutathione lyase